MEGEVAYNPSNIEIIFNIYKGEMHAPTNRRKELIRGGAFNREKGSGYNRGRDNKRNSLLKTKIARYYKRIEVLSFQIAFVDNAVYYYFLISKAPLQRAIASTQVRQ